MERLTLTYLGQYWLWSGTLYHMENDEGLDARVYVDSLGETWVDIRRIPEGGFFHSERVEAYRAFNGAIVAGDELKAKGFHSRRWTVESASFVRERPGYGI